MDRNHFMKTRSVLLRLFVFWTLIPVVIGCTTPTTLKPTGDLLQNAEQSFAAAESSESVRYAPDDFLAAKSALANAKTARQESTSTTNQDLKESKQKAARREAYEAWLHAEIAMAKAKEEKTKAQIKQLRQEITQFQSDRQRFEAEAQAAREKRAKEVAEMAKARALQETREAQKKAALEQAAKEAAERQAFLETKAKEQALKAQQEAEQRTLQETAAKEQALKGKQELESKLVAAMQEMAKVREEKRGLIVSLSDILFESGKSKLAPGARDNMTKLAKILSAYPDRQILVEGHTDNVGSDEFNQRLSQNRAQEVRKTLIEAGLNPDMIKATGFGKTKPIASNATAEGRQQNRRVEVVVLNPPAPPAMPTPAPASPPSAPVTPAPARP